jgi:uncharacterized protein involved in exopolysaccharide biosynthesis
MPREHRDLMDPGPEPDARAGSDWPGADRRLPQIEVVTRDAADDRPPPPRRGWLSYTTWFLAAAAMVAIPASLWNFSRPPVYRAAATVLTIVPEERSGYGGSTPDVQHVAIQRRLLLGRDLLEETLTRLADPQAGAAGSMAARPAAGAVQSAAGSTAAAAMAASGPLPAPDPAVIAALTPDDLLTMLAVEPVTATNLVEVSAEGDRPVLIAGIVNHWLDAYQALREREIETQIGGRLDKLDERTAVLEQSIQDKRDQIDAFRERFDIVTLGRDSNQAVKRLDNLQQALGKAEDESIAARAALEALQAALANGQVVVSERFGATLSNLRQQAAEARVAVEQLRERYTEMFIQSDPNKRALPEQLEALEARIAEVEQEGRREAILKAREAVDTTTRRVLELRRELSAQKITASRFSSGYAEYEDLKEDLAELEQMQRDTESKRVELGTSALVGYPQVEVIEPAHPPRDPIAPHYWRDLGYTLAAAGTAGLLTVLVLAWLDGRGRAQHRPQPVTGVRVWGTNAAADDYPHLPRHTDTGRLGAPAAPPREPGILPSPERLPPVPRQLMQGEVEALWELAGDAEQQLIGLLLCGVSPDEAARLTRASFDLAAGLLRVPAPGARELPLPPQLCALLADAERLPAWSADAGGLLFDDLPHRLSLLASDAGIAHADEVDAGTLRDSYLIFLIRQGLRLTQLEQVAGPMSGAEIRRFAPYSPPGASRPIEQIDLTYPLFA